VTGADLLALAPAIALGVAVVAALVAVSVRRGHRLVFGLTLAGLGLAAAALPMADAAAPRAVTALFAVDGWALALTGLLVAIAFGVAVLCYPYLRARDDVPEELYLLLLLATLGGVVLAAADHVAAIFLGLETLSVALYGLIGYLRRDPRSLEAAFKYLILAGTASAVFLFGAALLYAETGELALPALAASATGELAQAGTILLFAGLAFKLALVPFHLWTADVYQGAPAPVTAFVATVSKGAAVAVVARAYSSLAPAGGEPLTYGLAAIAVASILAGNLLALLQSSVKRVLAFSSVAHFGYLLVPLLAGGRLGTTAVAYYLAAYLPTALLAFGVVTVVSGSRTDADAREDYRGLLWRRPLCAAAFGLSLLSLAGIPLTSGFIAKFYVFAAGAGAGMWALVLVVAAGSAIGIYYYLRLLVMTFLDGAAELRPRGRLPWASAAVLAVAAAVVLWFGVYPPAAQIFAEQAAAALTGP
jgi:NADH-quinone oxidoreductase subunit N